MRALGNFLLIKRQEDEETESGLIMGQSQVFEIVSKGTDVSINAQVEDKVIVTRGYILIPVARYNNVFAVRESDVVAIV